MKTRTAVSSRPAARLAPMVSLLVLAGAALAMWATSARAQAPAPAAAAAATPVAQASAVKLSVNGMVCAFCAQGIEARLKKLPETADLYINLKQKVVAVQAKPGQTLAVDKLKAEVVEAGYEVTRAEPMTQTVAQLREQMRARQ
jgi:copper chaperone CopZ